MAVKLGTLPLLASLEGLQGLTACGKLEISDCDSLRTLAGLDTLQTVAYNLLLSGNARLADISQLAPSGPVGDVDIVGNPALDVCRVLDQVLAWSSVGRITVEGNGPCADGATPPTATALARRGIRFRQ